MKKPQTPLDLANNRSILQIPQSGPALSAAQKKFNQLLEQISAARADLTQWQGHFQHLRDLHVSAAVPAEKALHAAQRQMAFTLEAILLSPPPGLKLPAKRRRGLENYLRNLIEILLQVAPDDAELQALHDRHHQVDFATLREEDEQFERELAETMLRDLYGDSVLDGIEPDSSMEDFVRQAHAKVLENEDAAPEPKRNKRAQAAADRRKADEDALAQSLREIYRKLASTLHPDRESDLERREQKTALMQRINVAYQARDLLSLLSLQMEVEQIDSASLRQVPPQRLAQYNQILREQLNTLKDQRRSLLDSLYDLFPSVRPKRAPQMHEFQRAHKDNVRAQTEMTRTIEKFNRQLLDPKLRQHAVNELIAVAAEIAAEEDWLAKQIDDLEPYF